MKIVLSNKHRLLYVAVIAAMAIALTVYAGTKRAAAFAIFNVSNTNDSGAGSLRQAITDANAAGGGTINFAAGVNGIIDLQVALPDLSTNITLNGPGATSLTIQRSYTVGIPGFTIFRVTGSPVSISGLALKNGSGLYGGIYKEPGSTLTITGCVISSSSGDEAGGIFNGTGGSMTLTDSVVIHCDTRTGGNAGGINNRGTLTINGSTIANNYGISAVGSGAGGILNSGTLTINGSKILNNVSRSGSGIYNNGVLTVSNSTIAYNTASNQGAGILASGVSSTIINSTLANNSAGHLGGAIHNLTTVNIINSTLANNSASDAGGAIYSDRTLSPGPVNLKNSTVANNTSVGVGGISSNGAPLNLQSSIVAKNTGDISGVITSLGNNLIGDTSTNSGGDNAKGDLLNVDPLFELGPDSKPLLKDNGGPTETIALLAASPAIDKGKNLSGLTTDQRGTGFVRTYDNPLVNNIQGDGTDIGAFEVQQAFDFCLQDDSTNAILQINSQTGDYRLCCGGQSYSGRGQITRRGSVLMLESNTGNRRLQAKADQGTRRASASLQAIPGTTLCTISDRDFTNNNCVCSQ